MVAGGAWWVVGGGLWEVGGRWWGVRVHTFQKLESTYFCCLSSKNSLSLRRSVSKRRLVQKGKGRIEGRRQNGDQDRPRDNGTNIVHVLLKKQAVFRRVFCGFAFSFRRDSCDFWFRNYVDGGSW